MENQTNKERKKPNFYELTLSLVAKRLHKLYPDDQFQIQASTWSRSAHEVRTPNTIKYRIWSSQLHSRDNRNSSVEEFTLDRAFNKMCELKRTQEPRKVENFLREE